ncbi:uncharacterized protein LOC135846461 [Planococcus citri]|uniref:uncharacterized protein LOC135846461 n=1 Tax=Planococcus citri TaxID=170843 RepID=UPI0031F8E48C
MGVRGLQTFLDRDCASACRPVNVTELAEKYKNETGKDAIIVVDTATFYWPWFKGIDWLIGYEIQEYLHRLRTFVEWFQKIGVKLVFFVDGVTIEKKRQTWLSRKIRNLENILELCDVLDLEKGLRTRDIPEEYVSLPPAMDVITLMLLKHVLNCEVYVTIEECDEEMLEYVHENECMAIFTNDTDFIVSDMNKCKVLSTRQFDPRSMTTVLYDREALASSLNIRTDQLPLLAILAGNDYIDFEALEFLHRSLCGLRGGGRPAVNILMPAIGRYINTLSNQSIDKALETICVKIFGNKSELDLVKSSYNGYFLQKKCDDRELTNPSTKWSEILNAARGRNRNIVAPSYIWGILKDQVLGLEVEFEDLRKPFSELKPSATVTRALRQRMYGILLYEYEHLSDVKIEEWCAEHALSYHQPVFVKPTVPTVEHPGLLRLWSDDSNNELGEIKWKLFLWCISPNLISIDDWCTLTADLVAISATLLYLIEQEFIDEEELNAVIATVATYSLYSREKLKSLDYGVHNPRCTHISICVIRTFSFIVTLMAAVGYPVPLSSDLVYLKLEAKLFQIKFEEMRRKKSVQEMCENDDKSIEVFSLMKKVLGPAFQKSSIVESAAEDKGFENQADGDKQSEDDLAATIAEMKLLY